MPKYIELKAHLSINEVEKRYRSASDVVERSQWQILWLIGSGKRSREVSQVTGYSADWIRILVQRYNSLGVAAVGDGRHANPGQVRLLNAQQEAALERELEAAERDGAMWTGPEVAAWMSQQLGRRIYAARGWEVLRRLGYTSKTLRPRHAKADVEQQQIFKKTLPKSSVKPKSS
jgi:transposase